MPVILPSRLGIGLLAVGLWAGFSTQVAAQERVLIGDELLCPTCVIEFVEEVSIGGDDDPFGVVSPDAQGAAFHSSGYFWVVPSQGPGTLLRYDPEGRLLEIIDRDGDGPGELRGAGTLRRAEVMRDSLYVLIPGRLVATGADGAPGRSSQALVAPSDAVPLGDSAFLVNAQLEGVPAMVAVVSLEGEVVRTFPAPTRGLGPNEGGRIRIATSDRGGFWTVPEFEYRLTRWNWDGEPVEVIERTSDWYESWEPEEWALPRDDGLPTRVRHLREDEDGRLWVVTWVEAEDFEPFEDYADFFPLNPYHHPQRNAVVEVIDPARGQVIARQRFPGVVSGFRTGGRVALFDATPSGAQIIHFGRLRLVR